MKSRQIQMMLVALLVLGSSMMLAQNAPAQTKVGLHFTQAEIDIWKQRAVNGPYKEEWDLIKSRADAFMANPDSIWPGILTGACLKNSDPTPGRIIHRGLRDAGFVFLVTGDTSYRDKVLERLLLQAAEPGMNFTNTAIWCRKSGVSSSGEQTGQYQHNRWLDYGNMMRRLLFGYAYIRDTVESADRATLDAWFLEAGRWAESNIHNVIAVRVPGRKSNDYTCNNFCPGKDKGTTHFGGPTVFSYHSCWTNMTASGAAYVAAVGILLDDATLKTEAKRFFKEWLKFWVAPDSNGRLTLYDQVGWRTNNNDRQIAYDYGNIGLASVLTIADHFARAGDTELYDFSTNDGAFGSEGGPKSLLGVLRSYARITNGLETWYASDTETSDPDLRIYHTGPDGNRISWIWYTPANIYYNDPEIKTAYTRPLYSTWGHGGYDVRGGDWGSYPAIRFMFGQMEGKVLPYPIPGQTDSTPPSAPKNLSIISGGDS